MVKRDDVKRQVRRHARKLGLPAKRVTAYTSDSLRKMGWKSKPKRPK